MSTKNPFYITTTLPYVNSDPHIGHALEFVRADVIARYKRLKGYDVFFNTGTDEHGANIYANAIKEKLEVKEYVDKNAEKFKNLVQVLNMEGTHFIRTTSEGHIEAAKEIWNRCNANGDIYKKNYKVKYCLGCELEKTDSELVDNKCPIHPNREIEIREEENYFFKWSNYQQKLLDYYKSNPNFVIPDFRFNEIRAFVERGLNDFSISRLKTKMPWGVPVPGDDEHVMYVWFDALTSYISTLGWPKSGDFDKYWVQGEGREVIQYCGKDNIRQQSAMWQAMLMSAGLPNSTNIIIDGFIISGGQKMSKSIGNVINPLDIIDMFKGVTDYPEDVLRFVLLHDISSFEDGDLTMEGIKESYQSHLANGIGNLTSRVMKMATSYGVKVGVRDSFSFNTENDKVWQAYSSGLNSFNINLSIQSIWHALRWVDNVIQQEEPFKLIKTNPEKAKEVVRHCMEDLFVIAERLEPILPRTSAKILECIHENKMPEKPIFGRLL